MALELEHNTGVNLINGIGTVDQRQLSILFFKTAILRRPHYSNILFLIMLLKDTLRADSTTLPKKICLLFPIFLGR